MKLEKFHLESTIVSLTKQAYVADSPALELIKIGPCGSFFGHGIVAQPEVKILQVLTRRNLV